MENDELLDIPSSFEEMKLFMDGYENLKKALSIQSRQYDDIIKTLGQLDEHHRDCLNEHRTCLHEHKTMISEIFQRLDNIDGKFKNGFKKEIENEIQQVRESIDNNRSWFIKIIIGQASVIIALIGIIIKLIT